MSRPHTPALDLPPVPQVAREDPESVPALLSLGAVWIEDPDGEETTRQVAACKQDSVATDAQMAIADPLGPGTRNLGQARPCVVAAVDHEVIVSERVILRKGDGIMTAHGVGLHARR